MKLFKLLLLFLPGLFFLASCEDNIESEADVEYANWQLRNNLYFYEKMEEAKAAIAEAKAQYGADWQTHCRWGVARTQAKSEAAAAVLTDSICYEIVTTGSGDVSPLYTDSVSLNFAARLMPTDEHPEGKMFAYTGLYADEDNIFNPLYAVPSRFCVSNVVEGLTTALQLMHVGDRWRVYMHESLGYSSSAMTNIPAYSTLRYDVEMCGIYKQ